MSGILKIKRDVTTPASLNDGEFYLNKGLNTVQIGSGSSILTLVPLNKIVSGDIILNGNIFANNLNISSSYALTSSYSFYAETTGNVLTASFASTASTAATASFVLSSNVFGPWGFNSIISASYAVTAAFAPNYLLNSSTQSMLAPYLLISSTGSMLNPYLLISETASFVTNDQTGGFATTSSLSNYVLNSQTSSFVTNLQTSSFVTNSQTGSFLLTSQTGSMLNPYLLTSQTSSFVTNTQTASFVTNNQTSSFIINSQTSSMTVATASYVSSSNVYGPNGFNSILTSSYALTASLAIGIVGGASSVSSSYPFNTTGSSIFSYNANVLGTNISNVPTFRNIFIGESTAVTSSISESVIIGYQAAFRVQNSQKNVFIGTAVGQFASNTTSSVFIGDGPGANVKVAYSNFIGHNAGFNAFSASYSNFIGNNAGRGAYSASYSTMIGYNVGYRVGSTNTGLAENNIIIGTNVTLEAQRRNSINIGGILFGTGSYFNTGSIPFSGSVGGRIGINVPNPNYNLHVSGTIAFPNLIQTSASFVVMYDSASGQLFYTASSAIGGAGTGAGFPYTGDAIISGSLTITGSLIVLGSASFVSTSIIYASGSNILGDTINDTQTLIGTVIVSGSQQITGSLNVTGGITGSLQGTASWANNVTSVKSGYKDIGDFSGTPTLISSVTFSQAYSDNNYAVTVTGFDARSWTIESKDSGGFTINTNAKVPLSDKVFWVASSFNT